MSTARRQLDDLTRSYTREPRLGCDLTAHRDLGFCAACTGGPAQELIGWRLLAMAERGHPLDDRELAEPDRQE